MTEANNDDRRKQCSSMRRFAPEPTRRRRQCGAAMLEFAIAAPIVLGLILIMMDLSLMLWAQMTLQYAVREGARYAVVDHGNIDSSPTCNSVIGVIEDNSMGLTNILNPRYEIQINDGKNPSNGQSTGIDLTSNSCTGAMFGQRGDLMVLKLTATWPLATPLLQKLLGESGYTFSVSAIMQNEEH
jgi:hypothetical protein